MVPRRRKPRLTVIVGEGATTGAVIAHLRGQKDRAGAAIRNWQSTRLIHTGWIVTRRSRLFYLNLFMDLTARIECGMTVDRPLSGAECACADHHRPRRYKRHRSSRSATATTPGSYRLLVDVNNVAARLA